MAFLEQFLMVVVSLAVIVSADLMIDLPNTDWPDLKDLPMFAPDYN